MSEDKMRFEKWARDRGLSTRKLPTGDYALFSVGEARSAWQAALTQQSESELDPVREKNPGRCGDCGRAHILDTSLPSNIWNQIADPVDMLCAVCIDKRLTEKGLEAEAEFYFVGQSLVSKLYSEAPAPAVSDPIGAFGFVRRTFNGGLREFQGYLCNEVPEPANGDLLYTSPQPWIELAACLYQACGAYDMPERILDVLSLAQRGEPFGHLVDGLLPCAPQPEIRPIADWGNRRTDSFEGWLNELLTLVDSCRRNLPSHFHGAVETIVRGLQEQYHASYQTTPEVPESEPAGGAEAAAQWVEARRDAYIEDHGSYDPDTNVMEFPGDGEDYVNELDDIAEGIRSLSPQPTPQVPVAEAIANRVEQAIRPGPFCRDCADHGGRCPNSGELCDSTERAEELADAIRKLGTPVTQVPEGWDLRRNHQGEIQLSGPGDNHCVLCRYPDAEDYAPPNLVHDFAAALLAAPSIARERWINCEERLPRYDKGADSYGKVFWWDSRAECAVLRDAGEFEDDFTHWMPTGLVCPAPPGGGDQ